MHAIHLAPALMLLSGCASAELDRAGSLSSYVGLQRSDGILTHSEIMVNTDNVLSAKTVKIVPTIFAQVPANVVFSSQQRRLVANAIDRALCMGASARLKVVGPTERADLTVHAVVPSPGS